MVGNESASRYHAAHSGQFGVGCGICMCSMWYVCIVLCVLCGMCCVCGMWHGGTGGCGVCVPM